jgi:hypothetical protein
MLWRQPIVKKLRFGDGVEDEGQDTPVVAPKISDANTEHVRFLAMLPISQTELNSVEIRSKLERFGVDYSQWSPKNLEGFYNEVMDGEADLVVHQGADGKPALLRVVRVTVIRLLVHDSVLIEVAKEDMETKESLSGDDGNRLPAVKQRSNEHPFSAVRRHFNMHVGIDEEIQPYAFDKDSGGQTMNHRESPKLPGLPSVYLHSVVVARLSQPLDSGDFARVKSLSF